MDEISLHQELCSICKEILGNEKKCQNIKVKGKNTVNEASKRRGDSIFVEVGCKVHRSCYRNYTLERHIQNDVKSKHATSKSQKKNTREAKGTFDSKNDCLFCVSHIPNNDCATSSVMTGAFTQSILYMCDKRNDDWSLDVRGRIEYYSRDLIAAEIKYHHQCDTNFRNGFDLPLKYENEPEAKCKRIGRPKDEAKDNAFLKLCSYIERMDEELVTVSDLRDKMNEFFIGTDSDAYDNYYLKKKLMKHYGEDIHFSEEKGLSDIVTFREKTSDILRKYKELSDIGTDIEAHKKPSLKRQLN